MTAMNPSLMRPKTFFTLIGALAVAIGLSLLFSPVSTTAPSGLSVSCGSVALASRAADEKQAEIAGDAALLSGLGEDPSGAAALAASPADYLCVNALHGRYLPIGLLLGCGLLTIGAARFVRWTRPTIQSSPAH